MTAQSPSPPSSLLFDPYIIWDYDPCDNPIDQIIRDLSTILQEDSVNEHKLNTLIVAAESCFSRFPFVEFPGELKGRIQRLNLRREVAQRAYVLAFQSEIENSVHFVWKLIAAYFDEGPLNDRTEIHLSYFENACYMYQHLHPDIIKSIKTISEGFHTIEKQFGKVLPVTPKSRELFDRIKNAIQPIIVNPNRKKIEHAPFFIPAPSEVEELASIENWETIKCEELKSNPESSLGSSMGTVNFVKTQLTEFIEIITDRILVCYGDTFLKILVSPITDAFQSKKLQQIIENALSNTTTKFSPQEKKIWKDFLCSSLPETINNFLNVTTEKMTDPLQGYEFIHGITRMISSNSFKSPETVSSHHKAIILHLLPQITQFLRDYQTSVDLIKQFPTSSKESKENDILCAMIQNLHSRSSRIIFRNEQDPKIYAEDLNAYIENVILTQCRVSKIILPSPIKESVTAIATHYAYTVLSSLLSPFFIAIVIRRLIENDEKTQKPEHSSSVPPPKHSPDDQFSLELSGIIWDMIRPILNMGGNPAFIRWIIDTFDGTIKKELFTRARSVTEELHNILASDCVLMPFIILDKILFDHSEGGVSPVLKRLLTSDKNYQAKFAEDTIKQFQNRPYTIVSKFIRKETSAVTLFLAEKIGDLDTFLITLFNQLIELSQQERILKLLIVYLCDGYLNYLRSTDDAS